MQFFMKDSMACGRRKYCKDVENTPHARQEVLRRVSKVTPDNGGASSLWP